MNVDWQNTTVAALLVLAVGYIAYRGWLVVVLKKSGGCGSGCSSCDKNAKEEHFPLSIQKSTYSKARTLSVCWESGRLTDLA